MLVMIDHYDSFTYNLVQYLEELGEEIRVYPESILTCAGKDLLGNFLLRFRLVGGEA